MLVRSSCNGHSRNDDDDDDGDDDDELSIEASDRDT